MGQLKTNLNLAECRNLIVSSIIVGATIYLLAFAEGRSLSKAITECANTGEVVRYVDGQKIMLSCAAYKAEPDFVERFKRINKGEL